MINRIYEEAVAKIRDALDKVNRFIEQGQDALGYAVDGASHLSRAADSIELRILNEALRHLDLALDNIDSAYSIMKSALDELNKARRTIEQLLRE